MLAIKRKILDILGISASLLCAVHCIAFPIFMSLSFFNGWTHAQDHTFHWVILLIAIVLVGFAIIPMAIKHKYYLPLKIGTIGIVLFGIGLFLPCEIEKYFSLAGGIALIVAHYINWKKTH